MQSEPQKSKSSVSTGNSAKSGEPEKPSPKSTSKSKSKKSSPSDSLHVMLLASRFEVRGSSTQTLVLAEHLSDYGIRSTIVTPDKSCIAPRRRQQLDIREYRYLDVPLIRHVALRCVTQDFSAPVPDLIHIQSRKMLWAGIRLAKKLNRPFVLSVHDYSPAGEVLKVDAELCCKIIAVSASVKSELLTQPNITGKMVCVIHSGVEQIPTENLTPVLDPNCEPVIGTAGPLEQVKGVTFFLQAAQKILKEFPKLNFLVAGSGPEEKRLRLLVKTLGIQKQVTFVSGLHSFEESLHAMDIFCLPSLQQGLGTIMLEAMAYGRPVIASNVGGVFSAITPEETGLLIPASNSDAIAEKIIFLLKNPEIARKMGEAGREHVKNNFRIDQTVRRIADIYRSCCSEFKQNQEPGKTTIKK